jgi:hypothetical protein
MTPIEHYWPPELLAQAFPERFGHLVANPQPLQGAAGMAQTEPVESRPYTVEPVSGGCQVIRPRFGSNRRLRSVT